MDIFELSKDFSHQTRMELVPVHGLEPLGNLSRGSCPVGGGGGKGVVHKGYE